MKYYTADREAGNRIEEVKSVEDGLKLIEKYEKEDKDNNEYIEGFYDVIDENGISQL